MKRSLRYPRIAFSATCGIACVLLVVLWVRSYWWADLIFPSTSYRIVAKSEQGQISIGLTCDSWVPPFTYGVCGLDSSVLSTHDQLWGVEVSPLIGDRRLLFPHWFAVMMLLVATTLPWLPSRFSLRTLLIATALVSAVLGLIVYCSQ